MHQQPGVPGVLGATTVAKSWNRPIADRTWITSRRYAEPLLNSGLLRMSFVSGEPAAPRPRSLLRSQARCALASGATPRVRGAAAWRDTPALWPAHFACAAKRLRLQAQVHLRCCPWAEYRTKVCLFCACRCAD